MTTTEGAFYYPPLENLPTFDVLVFRNAQDVVDYAVSSGNATTVNLSSAATGTTYLVMSSVTASSTANLFTDNGGASYDTATNTADINITANAGSATAIALTSDNTAGTYYIPFSKTTSATSNALYIDNVTTPLTYNPSTSALTASSYGIRTTIPSTISASGANIDIINNNVGGVITMNNDLSFTSSTFGDRQINNTFYNLNDTTAVAGGAAQGRIYSDTVNTYIEGFVGNHNIIGTENSTVSARQLFNFGSSDATLYSPNIRLNASSFNVGQGAGDTSNVLIGTGTPRTIIYNAISNNTIIGGNAGNSLSNIASSDNTFIGAFAGELTTNAIDNTFVGAYAGSNNTTGVRNTFIGLSTGFISTTGTGNDSVCVGYQSGSGMLSTSNSNTLVGSGSGDGISTGTNNVCVGFKCGFQTGGGGTGDYNVCVGVSSGKGMITTANNNTLLGTSAGSGIRTAANNVCVGLQSGFQVGALGTGNNNTCVGNFSGDSMITTANGNTTYGFNSGASITTGANNTIIGTSSGGTLTTGSGNIVIGNGADVLTAAAANVIAIGTTAETMFIQGGFNLRVGSNITASITLTGPLAQFYSVTMAAAAQVITLPAPSTASVKGAYVAFKRKTNTTAYTIGAGLNSMMPVNSITSAATISIASGTFNIELVCDGTFWSVIQQA